MKIKLQKITIKDLVKGYKRDEESSEVVAFADENGKARLNIRPKYQREFVYKDEQQKAVIDTVLKGFPLNSMYWVKNARSNFEFEVLDGQQRTISICEFYEGNFSLNERYFHTLADDEKKKFLDYELMIYECEGEDSQKLEWFRVINIAGEKLYEQELRNAIYTSAWLSDAKYRFSKRNCLAEQKGAKYIKAVAIRQEILQKALMWFVGKNDDKLICEYMAKSAKDEKNADELWGYFCSVIDWVEMKFVNYREQMKSVEWGFLYNQFKDIKLDKDELEAKIAVLMQDEEVQKKSGIYEYVLSGDERKLGLRSFDERTKIEVYEKQAGICAGIKGFVCPYKDKKIELKQMEADHIIPWSKGGKTTKENCQMLCRECNRVKSNK